MAKYQIDFKDGTSHSYAYFEAEKKVEEAACKKANEELEKQRWRAQFRSFGYFKAIKTLTVKEWDKEKKQVKRGGHKFKLHLSFFQATFNSGRKERNEWYEYND
jgi:hypothetical protein